MVGRKNVRPEKISAEKLFGRKKIRTKKFSAENLAVRIAEGGSNGGGPGGRRPPPVRPSVRTSVPGLPVRGSGNWFGSQFVQGPLIFAPGGGAASH